MSVIDLIRSDLARFSSGRGALNFIKAYFRHPPFNYQVWLRLVNFLKKRAITKYTLTPLAYIFLKHYEWKYDIHINSNVEIGRGLYVVHGGCLFLNVESIGDNFTVYQGVTLGANLGLRDDIPKVMNDCTVCMGAKIFGDVVLGNNCIVAANAVVTRDVLENTVVAGIPARHLKDNLKTSEANPKSV